MSRSRPAAAEYPAHGARVAIVASRFNSTIVDRLLQGALEELDRLGVAAADRVVLRVAGAWEIPVALESLARRGSFDAMVALGAVVRGETPHFDFVAGECSRGIADVALRHALPIGFGVLTCDDEQQALDRAGGALGNKGAEATSAALELWAALASVAAAGAR